MQGSTCQDSPGCSTSTENVPITDVPITDVPFTDIPITDVPITDVPAPSTSAQGCVLIGFCLVFIF